VAEGLLALGRASADAARGEAWLGSLRVPLSVVNIDLVLSAIASCVCKKVVADTGCGRARARLQAGCGEGYSWASSRAGGTQGCRPG